MRVFFTQLELKKLVPSENDISEYVKILGNNNINFNDYLKRKYFPDDSVVIVADMSNRNFSDLDLKGVDFSSCIFKNTTFRNCDLTNATFCDVDFQNAYFDQSTLRFVDFRGSDLSNCRFAESYKDYSNLGKEAEIYGIKYSTTSSLARKYADIKSDFVRKKERDEKLEKLQKQLDSLYSKLSIKESVFYTLGQKTGNSEYDALSLEIEKIKENKFLLKTDNPMHDTFKNIFSTENSFFDPSYVRGSSKEDRSAKTLLVPLSREDVLEYLDRIKIEKALSLNDFAREKIHETSLDKGVKIVADLSSKIDYITNKWIDRVDLSGLDFSNADLTGVLFCGSILSKSIFINTNLSSANFESAELNDTLFQGVVADNTNFFNSNITEAKIKTSKFTHAFMSRSEGFALTISENSNFDYSNIKHAKWNEAKIHDSTLSYADLEGISLLAADLRRVQMKHSVLKNAVLEECDIIESDLSNSILDFANAYKAKIKKSILSQIEAQGIKLSESELDEFSKLDDANLDNAILSRINAEGASFINASLNQVEAEKANFRNAVLKNVSIKFSNLKGAILDSANLLHGNLSYSILEDVEARATNFTDAIMRRIDASNANFTEANFDNTDLTRSNLKFALFEQIKGAKMLIESADFSYAKLSQAQIDGSKIDSDTVFLNTDLSGVSGRFLLNSELVLPNIVQKNQQKESGELKIALDNFFTLFIDLTAISIESIKSIPELYNSYNVFVNFQKVYSKLQSDNLLLDEKELLKKELVLYGSELIKASDIVLKRYTPIINNNLNSWYPKIQMYLKPILNHIVAPIPIKELNNAKSNSFDLLKGVDSNFIQKSAPVFLNFFSLASKNDNFIKDVLKIYESFVMESENLGAMGLDFLLSLFEDKRISNFVKEDLSRFITSNNNSIATILLNYFDDKVGRVVSRELFESITSLFLPLVPIVLEDVLKMYKLYSEYTLINNSSVFEDKQNDSLLANEKLISNILDCGKSLLYQIAPFFSNSLPDFLTTHNSNILAFLGNEEVKNWIRSNNVDHKLVYDIVSVVMPFVKDFIPIASTFVIACFSNQIGLLNIILQSRVVANTIGINQKSAVKDLVNKVMDFYDKSSELKYLVQNSIPEVLINHAEALGPIIERVLNETEIGRKLKLEGERLLKVLGKQTKNLIEITDFYNNKEYSKMVRPILKIITDKNVFALLIKGAANLLNHAIQNRVVSNPIRKKIISDRMNNLITEVLKESDGSKKKHNFHALLNDKYNDLEKKTRSSVFEYSLRNKDFQGLSFSDNLKLDNLIIKGFNFNDTEFTKSSFINSTIQNCSFKDAFFKEYIDFEGATIDVKSLTTLIPAIERYNKVNLKHQITLSNIKIDGELTDLLRKSPILGKIDKNKVKVEKSLKVKNEKGVGLRR